MVINKLSLDVLIYEFDTKLIHIVINLNILQLGNVADGNLLCIMPNGYYATEAVSWLPI